MTGRVSCHGLEIARDLFAFVNDEVLPGLDIDSDDFWAGFAKAVTDLTPENRDLLHKRATLQQAISAWHIDNRDKGFDAAAYKQFLQDIGYLVDGGDGSGPAVTARRYYL